MTPITDQEARKLAEEVKQDYKLIAREPTEEMLDAQHLRAGVGRDLARKCFMQMFDFAPDIETEVEKKAKEYIYRYDKSRSEGALMVGYDLNALEIIRALLRERGK